MKRFVIPLVVLLLASDLCRGVFQPPVGIAIGGTGTAYAAPETQGGVDPEICRKVVNWVLSYKPLTYMLSLPTHQVIAFPGTTAWGEFVQMAAESGGPSIRAHHRQE